MKKVFIYLVLAIVLSVIAFLTYRFVITMNNGPSDEQLKENKKIDDEVVVPSKLDALEATFDEDSTSTDSTSN